MKRKQCLLTLVISLACIATAQAQADGKALLKEFRKTCGYWTGRLTYLDYSSGKPYTMPANIEIRRIGKTSRFILANSYPNEASANETDTLTLSADGRYLDREAVTSRRRLPDGNIEIITEELGKDGNDNRPARFRHTYILGKKEFRRRKDVQFVGETAWINRHEYVYSRAGN